MSVRSTRSTHASGKRTAAKTVRSNPARAHMAKGRAARRIPKH